MCGLFGFSGKQKADLNKIKILALYNIERGTDSTGILINNEAIKSLGSAKKFLDNNKLKYTQDEERTIIGHTRKSSSGSISLENAHPFVYPTKEDELHSAFAHNGTLYDWKKDMAPYLKNPEKFNVDSKALGLVMANGHYKYLEDYDGAVTYVMSRIAVGNTLEVFKGASLAYTASVTPVEDRPLYALYAKEGVYVSSLEESLTAIQEEGEEIEDLPINTVLRYQNGELVKSIPINRHKEKAFPSYTKSSYSKNAYSPTKTTKSGNGMVGASEKKQNASEKKEDGRFFWSKTIDYSTNVFKSAVYFDRGRYYRNGHLLDSFQVVDGKVLVTPLTINSNSEVEYVKDQGNYYFKGLELAVKNDQAALQIHKTLTTMFNNVKKYNVGSLDIISCAVSRYVKGYFAFLPNELYDHSVARFGVYKDGENLIKKDKGVVFQTKGIRKVKYYISVLSFRVFINDFENDDVFFRDLADTVDDDRVTQCEYLGLTQKNLHNLFETDNDRHIGHIDTFFEKLQVRENIDFKEEEEPANWTALSDDCEQFLGDSTLFLERLDSEWYGNINTEALQDSLSNLILDLQSIQDKALKTV